MVDELIRHKASCPVGASWSPPPCVWSTAVLSSVVAALAAGSVMAWRGKPMYAIVIAGLASQWAALLVLAVRAQSPAPVGATPGECWWDLNPTHRGTCPLFVVDLHRGGAPAPWVATMDEGLFRAGRSGDRAVHARLHRRAAMGAVAAVLTAGLAGLRLFERGVVRRRRPDLRRHVQEERLAG